MVLFTCLMIVIGVAMVTFGTYLCSIHHVVWGMLIIAWFVGCSLLTYVWIAWKEVCILHQERLDRQQQQFTIHTYTPDIEIDPKRMRGNRHGGSL